MYAYLNKVYGALSLLVLGGSLLSADQISVNEFKYLNSNENSTIIDNAAAQDLLNVDISPRREIRQETIGEWTL
jgi:hypothetical protein